jgi:hypothetical protein
VRATIERAQVGVKGNGCSAHSEELNRRPIATT